MSRVCQKSGWWRSADRIATPWPWKLPTIRNQCSSTRDTCNGCGTWTGSDIWIYLLVWLQSVWATATREGFCFPLLCRTVMIIMKIIHAIIAVLISGTWHLWVQESSSSCRAADEETVAHDKHLRLSSSPWVLWETSLLLARSPKGTFYLLFFSPHWSGEGRSLDKYVGCLLLCVSLSRWYIWPTAAQKPMTWLCWWLDFTQATLTSSLSGTSVFKNSQFHDLFHIIKPGSKGFLYLYIFFCSLFFPLLILESFRTKIDHFMSHR